MINTKFKYLQSTINNLNLEILEHGYLQADSDWQHYSIHSPFNRLYWITKGEAFLQSHDTQILLQPFYIYLIPAYSTYDYICHNSMEKFYLHFRLEHLPGLDVFIQSKTCLHLRTTPELVNQLLIKTQSHHLQDIIFIKSFILNTLSDFIMNYQINTTTSNHLIAYQPLFQYIKEQGHANLSIPSLAAYCNTSYDTLSKNFKRDIGITLKQYLNSKLIEKAKEYLLITPLTIKQIAYELKFTDEFYFSRFFSKHCGISPSEYRKSYKI